METTAAILREAAQRLKATEPEYAALVERLAVASEAEAAAEAAARTRAKDKAADSVTVSIDQGIEDATKSQAKLALLVDALVWDVAVIKKHLHLTDHGGGGGNA